VSLQRQLEAELRQAHKMEAVGQLAGGIAHDFNNLLTVISGNLELADADLPDTLPADAPLRLDLSEIGQSATRAHGLVRQLLAFSRKQAICPQRLRLGAVVLRAEQLLRRVIGEEILLTVDVAAEATWVEADAGQLEQVLLNLAVNARDAMLTARHGHPGTGGALRLEVDALTVGADEARPGEDLTPGAWVRLLVRDTGHGMDATTRARAFEPFFTTKQVGAGTGLGLSTVFGIVRQAGGAVRIESAPGAGTTFTLLFPACPAAEDRVDPAGPPTRRAAAEGVVLLVEDEAPVRATARRLLERRGYTVLEARHGGDALLVWGEHGARVDALVTDLRMPEMGGRELASRLRAERPALPVVLMSGYVDAGWRHAAPRAAAFVEKPFTGAALLSALEGAMAGRVG
jgi:nitrogen-specific signal transduction histidine kinase/CheY-like chemotaxis protein